MIRNDGYVMRRAIAADRDALRAFAKEVWPTRAETALEHRWWWYAEPKQCLVAASTTGEIAAITGARECRLAIGADVVPATDICEWYVSPRYAGQGLGRALVSELMAQREVLRTISISDAAVTGFTRLGWNPPAYVPMLLSPVPGAARRLIEVARWLRPGRGLGFEEQDVSAGSAAGAEFDDLWRRAKPVDPIVMVRDAHELRWRLSVTPHRRYRLVTSYHADVLVGYMVSRVIRRVPQLKGLPTGFIVDSVIDRHTPEVFGALLTRTLRWFDRQHAHVALTIATSREHTRSLALAGFVSANTPIIGRALGRLRTRYSAVSPTGRDFAGCNWYFTPADSDLDLGFGADTATSDPGEN